MREWLPGGIHDASPKVTDESEDSGLNAPKVYLHCYGHKVVLGFTWVYLALLLLLALLATASASLAAIAL